MYKNRGTEPPCDTCTPQLIPENKDVVEVYFQCCNQLIMAPMGGAIDIDIQAVDVAIKRLKPENPDRVFKSVLNLARKQIKKEREANA